jgi:MFS family permease
MQILNVFRNKAGMRKYPAAIWTAMAIQAVRSTGYSIPFVYLPLYLYEQRHVSMTLVGSVLFMAGIVSGLFQIIGGVFADRFGHRKMFITYQVTDTLLFGVLAVLIGTNAPVWCIFMTSVMVTVGTSMSNPAISALVADISQKESLTESYGMMAIGGNLGWAIGPLTGAYLQGTTSYAWVFAIGALIASLALIGTPFLPGDTALKTAVIFSRKTLKGFLSNPTLMIFCGLCTLFYLEVGQWGSTLSVFTVDRVGFTPGQYGLLMSISGILIVVFQYPISTRIELLGRRWALFLGSLCYGLGFLSFTWVKSFAAGVVPIVIMVTGEMLFVPTIYAVIGSISHPENRAKNLGFLGLCNTVGSSFGPLLGGYLLDKFTIDPLYVWGPISLPAFLAAVGFLLWQGYTKAIKSELTKTYQK